MKNKFIIFKLILIVICSEYLFSAAKIAVTTKVSGKVSIEAYGQKGFSDLKAGTIITDGDRIKTGPDGFTVIIYIDDKSVVKVKENTELIVKGNRKTGSINKQVDIDTGTLRAQVNKQRKGDFVVQSATSVASVKGTDFWFISDPVNGDMIIGLEGLVNLMNLSSGESSDVGAGTSGSSTPDGNVESSDTNPDNIPDDPDNEDAPGTQIEIQLEGPDGEVKTLLIEIE